MGCMRLTAPQPLIQCSGAWLSKCSVVCCVTQVEYARHISALAAAGRGFIDRLHNSEKSSQVPASTDAERNKPSSDAEVGVDLAG